MLAGSLPVAGEERGGTPPRLEELVVREATAASEVPPPPEPGTGRFSVQMVLDDGTIEGAVGVGAAAARQFMWFQRFSPGPSPFDLEEIWVLFPEDPQISPGAPVQLVVYSDPDGQPETGAELLWTSDEVVQAADDATFSIYPVEDLLLPGGDILIAVVNRYVESGVSPPTQPAALDTSSASGRAWIATWTGDPPDPPVFPPNQSLFQVDIVSPGHWMIRGFGGPPLATDVPALGRSGEILLGLLLAALGWRVLRRR